MKFSLTIGVCLVQLVAVMPSHATGPVEIHSIPMGGSQGYLIETQGGMVLVDAGYPGHEKRVARLMKKLGRSDLKLILLTHAHFDHFGSAAAIRKFTGAPIAIHAADSQALAQGETRIPLVRSWGRLGKAILPLAYKIWDPVTTPPDIVVEGGESLGEYGLNAIVLHTPGHTPGSCCLIVEDSLVFVGDLVASRPRPFVQKFYADDWREVARSLELVKSTGVAKVYCGHGRRVLERKRLLRLRASVRLK